jgi:hypothetical protein
MPSPAPVVGELAVGEEGKPPIPLRAVMRFVLGCWDGLVWLLLVALPGVWHSLNLAGFVLHFPYVLIGLVILGGVYYAIRALADGHLLWFSAVLFLLGTWM